jgi:isopentenyl-diphosphate delta-isomerase
MNGRQVLLQQRAFGKYHTPGLWTNTCCTHPFWGEDPATCARRRLIEELGIEGLALRSAGRLEYRAPVGPDLIEHEVVDVFLAEAGRDLTLRLDPDEVHAVRWVDLAELAREVAATPALFTPWLGIYLSRHHDQIFGDLAQAAPG